MSLWPQPSLPMSLGFAFFLGCPGGRGAVTSVPAWTRVWSPPRAQAPSRSLTSLALTSWSSSLRPSDQAAGKEKVKELLL